MEKEKERGIPLGFLQSDSSQPPSSQPPPNHTSPHGRAISISSSSSLSTVSTIATPSPLKDASPSPPNPYTTIKPSSNLSPSQRAQFKTLLLDREIERVKTLMHKSWFALNQKDKSERINRQTTHKKLFKRNGFKAPHNTWYDYFHPENEVAVEHLPDGSGWRVWACERVRGHCFDDDAELRRERKLRKAKRRAKKEAREELKEIKRQERSKAYKQLFEVEGDVDDSESEGESESDSNEGDDSETEDVEEIDDEDDELEEDLEVEEEDEESEFEVDESDDDGSDDDYHLPGTVKEGKATLKNHNRSPDRKGKAKKSRPGLLSVKGYY